MIIGVNARFLTKLYTGIGQYTHHLFSAFARKNPEYRIEMIVPESVDVDMPGNVNITVVRESFLGTSGMKKTYWEQVQIPKVMREKGVDIFHCPYPSNPWNGFNKPVVLTVHDTIPWTLPEYRQGFLTRLYQNKAQKAVKVVDKIITVSDSSRNEIVESCGVKKDMISLVSDAPAPIFLKAVPENKIKEVLKKYNIEDKPYFLYVGGFDTRKNVGEIINAFNNGIASDFDINLVLAGGKLFDNKLYSSFDSAESGAAASLGIKKVVSTGFVDESDLPALYQGAFAFVNISINEGFNLPIIEAAVSGIPLIVSNIPVHHEVIGMNAIYNDPDDVKGLSNIMKRLASDRNYYSKQKQKMEQYQCPYSWEKSASELLSVYRSLLK